MCQEEIHVYEGKIKVIKELITPTSLKTLKVFVQNVCSLERFIHMLTCLLPSRSMYHTVVLGSLNKQGS